MIGLSQSVVHDQRSESRPMRMLFASCILAWSVAPAISAQDKPDFSGDWILVSPVNGASNAPRTMTVRQSFKRESVKGTPIDPPLITLAVERRLNSGVHSELYTIDTEGNRWRGGWKPRHSAQRPEPANPFLDDLGRR